MIFFFKRTGWLWQFLEYIDHLAKKSSYENITKYSNFKVKTFLLLVFFLLNDSLWRKLLYLKF